MIAIPTLFINWEKLIRKLSSMPVITRVLHIYIYIGIMYVGKYELYEIITNLNLQSSDIANATSKNASQNHQSPEG